MMKIPRASDLVSINEWQPAQKQIAQRGALLPTEIEHHAYAILREYRSQLTKQLGRRAPEFQEIEIRQWEMGPALQVSRERATIYVGPYATEMESVLESNVAHEAVHLHVSRDAAKFASGIEEGFAVYFELTAVESRFGSDERQKHFEALPQSYFQSLSDYQSLLEYYCHPAASVYQRYGKLSGLSIFQLKKLFPKTNWIKVFRLARRKQMRPWS